MIVWITFLDFLDWWKLGPCEWRWSRVLFIYLFILSWKQCNIKNTSPLWWIISPSFPLFFILLSSFLHHLDSIRAGHPYACVKKVLHVKVSYSVLTSLSTIFLSPLGSNPSVLRLTKPFEGGLVPSWLLWGQSCMKCGFPDHYGCVLGPLRVHQIHLKDSWWPWVIFYAVPGCCPLNCLSRLS